MSNLTQKSISIVYNNNYYYSTLLCDMLKKLFTYFKADNPFNCFCNTWFRA